jgi:hypothetical protein
MRYQPVTRDRLGKPTNSEYAIEAGINLLDTFVEISKQIPVPGVPEVVAIAVSVIRACEVRTCVNLQLLLTEFILLIGEQRNVGRSKALTNSHSKSDDDSNGRAQRQEGGSQRIEKGYP